MPNWRTLYWMIEWAADTQAQSSVWQNKKHIINHFCSIYIPCKILCIGKLESRVSGSSNWNPDKNAPVQPGRPTLATGWLPAVLLQGDENPQGMDLSQPLASQFCMGFPLPDPPQTSRSFRGILAKLMKTFLCHLCFPGAKIQGSQTGSNGSLRLRRGVATSKKFTPLMAVW